MRDATKSVHHPSVDDSGYAALGIPTHRASTIVFPDAQSYAARGQRDLDSYSYGLHGTPTQRVLEAQLASLENGKRAVVLPSGQAAVTVVLLSVLMPGDHVLVPDTAYPPVLGFCRNFLEPRGIEWSIYMPGVGAAIQELVRDNTKLIWMESPGSTTMEIEDVPAIANVARAKGILTGIDNTWATPLLFKPLDHGVDFSMQALTKYPGGHSDVLMGSVAVNDLALRKRLRDTMRMIGFGVCPDSVQLVLRGLETMAVRLAHVGKVATEVASELAERGLGEVLYPALPTSQGHDIWKRDFSGSSGLFSVVLPKELEPCLDIALNALRYFSIGASWGGTRSLIAPMSIKATRQTHHPRNERTILRISIGLEDPADLREDLADFFATLSNEAVARTA